MNNLAEEQELMKERWANREKVVVEGKVSFVDPEQTRINKMLARTDLKCLHCGNPTTANRRDGSINPCKECHTLKMRIAKHGMGLGQYFRMYEEQKGRCAICDEFYAKLVVDHCHTLLHPRGLLCKSCNVGLGFFKDNKQRLINAVKYLSYNDLHDDWNIQGEVLSTRKKKQVVLNKYVMEI